MMQTSTKQTATHHLLLRLGPSKQNNIIHKSQGPQNNRSTGQWVGVGGRGSKGGRVKVSRVSETDREPEPARQKKERAEQQEARDSQTERQTESAE